MNSPNTFQGCEKFRLSYFRNLKFFRFPPSGIINFEKLVLVRLPSRNCAGAGCHADKSISAATGWPMLTNTQISYNHFWKFLSINTYAYYIHTYIALLLPWLRRGTGNAFLGSRMNDTGSASMPLNAVTYVVCFGLQPLF